MEEIDLYSGQTPARPTFKVLAKRHPILFSVLVSAASVGLFWTFPMFAALIFCTGVVSFFIWLIITEVI